MPERIDDSVPVTTVYYEYWCDGVMQKCFKDHDTAVKYCKVQKWRAYCVQNEA